MDLKIKWKGIEKKFCLNDNLSESETIIIFEARHLLLKGNWKREGKETENQEREGGGGKRERERESKREGHGQEPK